MEYTKEETRDRFEAALRGARIAGHKPMSAIKKKRAPTKAKKKSKK
jgi:hypothetical protein